MVARLLRATISTATEAVIWLSTWGDSTRMAKDLAEAKRDRQSRSDRCEAQSETVRSGTLQERSFKMPLFWR